MVSDGAFCICPKCGQATDKQCHSDSNASQMIHEDLMEYSIEGCTEVEEDQDRE